MAKGRVKWFNDAKGYGFITIDSAEDAFVHYSAVRAQGFKTLSSGEVVELEVRSTPKGLQAVEVRRWDGRGSVGAAIPTKEASKRDRAADAKSPPRTFRPTDAKPSDTPAPRAKARRKQQQRKKGKNRKAQLVRLVPYPVPLKCLSGTGRGETVPLRPPPGDAVSPSDDSEGGAEPPALSSEAHSLASRAEARAKFCSAA